LKSDLNANKHDHNLIKERLKLIRKDLKELKGHQPKQGPKKKAPVINLTQADDEIVSGIRNSLLEPSGKCCNVF